MKICPQCQSENSDSAEFCTQCGSKLSSSLYEPRMHITDNLKYAWDIASSNIKVFYPTLIMFGAMIGIIIVMFISIGLSFIGFTSETGNFSGLGIIVFFALWLTGMYLGLVSIPTFQDVYKSAVLKAEINIRQSFDYGRSRFFSYLGAFFIIAVLWFIIGFIIIFPLMMRFVDFSFDPSAVPDQIGFQMYQMMVQMAPVFLIMIIFGAAISLSLCVMAWDDVGFFPAVKSSLGYFRKRWKDLVVVFIIMVVSSLVGVIPFGFILTYVIIVVLNLAVIDNYLSYQTTLNQEPQ